MEEQYRHLSLWNWYIAMRRGQNIGISIFLLEWCRESRIAYLSPYWEIKNCVHHKNVRFRVIGMTVDVRNLILSFYRELQWSTKCRLIPLVPRSSPSFSKLAKICPFSQTGWVKISQPRTMPTLRIRGQIAMAKKEWISNLVSINSHQAS